MRNLLLFCGLAAVLAFTAPARADVHLGAGALLGTGVVRGDADNNPYLLQVGAYGELELSGFVLGVRGTRSFADDAHRCFSNCRVAYSDRRTIGLDFGYAFELPIVRIGPRLGVGHIREPDIEAAWGFYFEPGVAADVQLSVFNLGAELRYRWIADLDGDGFLALLRLGVRF